MVIISHMTTRLELIAGAMTGSRERFLAEVWRLVEFQCQAHGRAMQICHVFQIIYIQRISRRVLLGLLLVSSVKRLVPLKG